MPRARPPRLDSPHLRPVSTKAGHPSVSAPLLPPDENQRVQVIVGIFLYYGLGIDSTILVTLNESGGQQSTATTDTEVKCVKLMDYLHTPLDAVVRFHASDIILYIESDAA